MGEWVTMPMWYCPTCGKNQQQDDYYDFATGRTITCRSCHQQFTITMTDYVLYVEIEPVIPGEVKESAK